MKLEDYKRLLEKMNTPQKNSIVKKLDKVGFKVNGFANLNKAPLMSLCNLFRNPKKGQVLLELICDEFKINELFETEPTEIDTITAAITDENKIGVIAYMLANSLFTDQAINLLHSIELPLNETMQNEVKVTDKKDERFRAKYMKQREENQRLNESLLEITTKLSKLNTEVCELREMKQNFENESILYRKEINALQKQNDSLVFRLQSAENMLQEKQKQIDRKKVLFLGSSGGIGNYEENFDVTTINTYDTATIRQMSISYDELWIIQSEIEKLSFIRSLSKDNELSLKLKKFSNPAKLVEYIEKESFSHGL